MLLSVLLFKLFIAVRLLVLKMLNLFCLCFYICALYLVFILSQFLAFHCIELFFISIELQQNWLIHFVKHNIDLATAWLEDYGPFAVARRQISICSYIAIVHFSVFDVCFLSKKKINFCSVLMRLA